MKTFEQCQRKHFAKSERQGWLRSAVGERLKASHRRCHFPNQQQHMVAESLHCPLTPVFQCSQCLEKLKQPSSSQHVLSSHHSGRVFLPALQCNTSGLPNGVHRTCCDKGLIPDSYLPLLRADGTALSANIGSKKGRDSCICLQCAQMGHLALGLI